MAFNKKFMPDDYCEEFGAHEEQEFLKEISDMEAAGRWEDHKTGELGGLRTYIGPMFLDEAIRDARPDIHHNAIIDSVEGTANGLFLQMRPDVGFDDDGSDDESAKKKSSGSALIFPKRDCVPLRQNAIRQLINTALAVSDEMQLKDEVSDPAFFCNLFKAVKGARFRENRVNQIWICAGKISAVGSQEYCKMPIDQVFAAVVPALMERFPVLEFSGGSNSFEKTKATYKIGGEEAEKLREKYEKMVNRPDRTARVIPGMTFTVAVQTSNAKSSAALLTPLITTDTGARIPVGKPLRVDHKKRPDLEGIDLLVSKAPETFAQFGDPHSKFADMSNVVINNPKDCLINLCDKAGLPKKLVGMCLDDLEACLGDETSCTMFDIYLSICQMTAFADGEGYSVKDIDDIEEGVARILGYRWTDCDKRADV